VCIPEVEGLQFLLKLLQLNQNSCRFNCSTTNKCNWDKVQCSILNDVKEFQWNYVNMRLRTGWNRIAWEKARKCKSLITGSQNVCVNSDK
jgi:hypothetical protein